MDITPLGILFTFGCIININLIRRLYRISEIGRELGIERLGHLQSKMT
jgi:hypothetical protein